MTKSSGEDKTPSEGAPRYPHRGQFDKRPDPNPIADGKPVVLRERGPWKKKLAAFLEAREQERRHEYERWNRESRRCHCDGKRPQMPRPYLDATSNFGPQITALSVGTPGNVQFTVWNDGIYPAWSCYVEVYEGPGGYTSPLSAYELRGRRIITLHPGERREVSLPWVRRQRTGRIVGLVFDPLLDPHGLDLVVQVNRHLTSVHYVDLE